jgi:hypothetical protein
MKILRILLCFGMICFLVFSPKALLKGAQASYVDPRFVRDPGKSAGTIVLYHIVRHRPYTGSLTQWLKSRAAAYEKKHKGVYIEIEGMDEAHFAERLQGGRRPDAYSFFSGTMYPDRLKCIENLHFPYRDGLFQTDRCVPYCYSGYTKLIRTPDGSQERVFFANDILAARAGPVRRTETEDRADVLYLDLRRAGDLIRYRDGFALASPEPLDSFTDAVCWLGIDRDTDDAKSEILLDFFAYLLEPDPQQTLNALGLMSVRSDVKDTPPEPALKRVFRTYQTVETVDPFRWNAMYDSLLEDAKKASDDDSDARERFTKRLRECCS